MGNINVLDSSVFNRIAAGEVVEKPASVVKELLENSIDSGANKIIVRIADGGKFIKITDNGCGIAYDDLTTAFLPHATSKISSIKDLDSIGTLGFRGEALPSIASVSKVTVVSRKADDELGGEIIVEDGKNLSVTQKGAPVGTTVTVENLFKHVPARLKFLRSDRGEEGEITTLMQRMIIANFDKSFAYFIGDKEVFRSDGNGLKEAIYSVYGASFLKETEFISSTMSDITLYGYISKPAFSKHNKSFQTLIVNGRYVNNQDVSFWVYNCFSEFLMKRQYPAYVLFIDIPNDMVDINVHPNKMEVKFVDFDRIRRMLSSAIKESLTHSTSEPKLIELNNFETAATIAELPFVGAKDNNPPRDTLQRDTLQSGSTFSVADPRDEYPTVKVTGTFGFNSPDARASEIMSSPKIEVTPPKARQFALFHDVISGNNPVAEQEVFDISAYTYRGKLFDTYLLFELGCDVVIIDQHAAHEKLLYKKYSSVVENGINSIQDLMLPFVFDVDAKESEMIDEHMAEIEAIGFALNKLAGNSYSLSSIPLVLSEMKLGDFAALLTETLKRNRFGKKEFLKDDLMQSACKAAVKGAMSLSDSEIEKLVDSLKTEKIELFCPHGRPIAIKIKRGEIEKWFKRIV